jgi:hypothetical protein
MKGGVMTLERFQFEMISNRASENDEPVWPPSLT